jgi:hypothetical protein
MGTALAANRPCSAQVRAWFDVAFSGRIGPMRTRAAVAIAAGKPLEIMEVNLDDPKEGEVLIEIKATGICHTDEFTLSGADPEGMFPLDPRA